jgi:hypothetical protein
VTARNAERITGLFIRQIPNGSRYKTYGIFQFEFSDVPLYTAASHEPSEAISRLVEWAYRALRERVCAEQNYRCLHCNLIKPLQFDHIKPRAKGRVDDRLNGRGVCPSCHEHITKGGKLQPHPKMLQLMSNIGLRWIGNYRGPMQACGWERIQTK